MTHRSSHHSWPAANHSGFDALVTVAQITLRMRKQWHGGATAFADIDAVVNECSDLLFRAAGRRELCEAAIAELKLRSAAAAGGGR